MWILKVHKGLIFFFNLCLKMLHDLSADDWSLSTVCVHRKVEFPEARIYEETLNILLYEPRDGLGAPDKALLEATGGVGGGGGGSAGGCGGGGTRSHTPDDDDDRERIERVRRIHVKRLDDRSHQHQ